MNCLDDLFISPLIISANSAFAIILPFSIAKLRSGDTAVPTPKIHSFSLSEPSNNDKSHAFVSEKSAMYHFGTLLTTSPFSDFML